MNYEIYVKCTLIAHLLLCITANHQFIKIEQYKYPEFNTLVTQIEYSRGESFFAINKKQKAQLYNNTNKNLGAYKSIFIVKDQQPIQDIKFTSDNSQMVVQLSSKIQFYSTNPFEKKDYIPHPNFGKSKIAISNDNKFLVASYSDTYNVIVLYDMISKIQLFSKSIFGIKHIQFSPFNQNLLLILHSDINNIPVASIYQISSQQMDLFYSIGLSKDDTFVDGHFSKEGKYLYLLSLNSLVKYNLSDPFSEIQRYQDKSVNFTMLSLMAYDKYIILNYYNNSVRISILKVLNISFNEIQNISITYDNNSGYALTLGISAYKGMILVYNPTGIGLNKQFQLTKYSLCQPGQLYQPQNNLCKACNVKNCNICSKNANKCQSCFPNYYVDQFDQCSKCYQGCQICNMYQCFWCQDQKMKNFGNFCQCQPSKFFDDSDNLCKYCQELLPGCQRCLYNSTINPLCQQCDQSNNWQLRNKSCYCSEQFYESITQHICIKCLPNCKQCSNGNNCNTCMEGYDNMDTQCVLPTYQKIIQIGFLCVIGFLLLSIIIFLIMTLKLMKKIKKVHTKIHNSDQLRAALYSQSFRQ